ncbi:hypothetical protein NHX12_010000 [Muraenolepis orangiensis]|uniref:G-protein coupled receptors family 1 profile domain-containing protein n=1 Tax=Muraenolepis orangiensis TaxID=630683 RepID=A0A9Q0I6W0_9TELE|nr:hypothetical protein NHX12_010000 [Muraenolepis orangiensis]
MSFNARDGWNRSSAPALYAAATPALSNVSSSSSSSSSDQSANQTDSNHTAPLDLSRAIPVGMVLASFIMFAIVGNIMVILSVVCNRHLRIPTNYFIINLAIADLLLGTTVLPVSATLEVLDHWVFGRIFCDIWAAVDVLCCTASIMSLCAISIDRYIGVSYPLQYPMIVTKKRALLAMLGVWVLAIIISIGPLLGWKQPPSQDDTECPITEEPFYALFSSLGSFYIPLAVILAMYCQVYVVAKRTTRNLEAGVMKEDSNECSLRVTGSFNANLRPPETFFKVIFWLGYFNSCLNPIIYPCYSREFKLAFIRILRCQWKRKKQGWQAYYNYRCHQGSNVSSYLNGSQQTLSSVHPSPRCVASSLAPTPWTSRGGHSLSLSPSLHGSPCSGLQVQHAALPSVGRDPVEPVSPLAREGRPGAGGGEVSLLVNGRSLNKSHAVEQSNLAVVMCREANS